MASRNLTGGVLLFVFIIAMLMMINTVLFGAEEVVKMIFAGLLSGIFVGVAVYWVIKLCGAQ